MDPTSAACRPAVASLAGCYNVFDSGRLADAFAGPGAGFETGWDAELKMKLPDLDESRISAKKNIPRQTRPVYQWEIRR
jgi:hypothetical protein